MRTIHVACLQALSFLRKEVPVISRLAVLQYNALKSAHSIGFGSINRFISAIWGVFGVAGSQLQVHENISWFTPDCLRPLSVVPHQKRSSIARAVVA